MSRNFVQWRHVHDYVVLGELELVRRNLGNDGRSGEDLRVIEA